MTNAVTADYQRQTIEPGCAATGSTAEIAARQMSLLFDGSRPERVEVVERSKVATAFTQILVLAAGVGLEELDDAAHGGSWDLPVKIGTATVRPPVPC